MRAKRAKKKSKIGNRKSKIGGSAAYPGL